MRVTPHAKAVAEIAASICAERPIHRYSDYLRRRYGEKTYRVSVDAGFTCPVRDHSRPCTYCDPRGSRAPYLGAENDLREQIVGARDYLERRYGARRFLLYFQAFSSTYAPVDELRRIYDLGLACGEFAGLVVSTRPDCLDEQRAALLAEYAGRGIDVWLELGLQSAHDRTLRRVRRGHSAAEFDRAARLAREAGLLIAAHLIVGLPGEGRAEVVETVRHLSTLGVDAVKFHNLVITRGTMLYRLFREGRASALSGGDYMRMLIEALENLPPETIVMRLTCDPPRDVDTVPAHLPEKAAFNRQLVEEMRSQDVWQGKRWTQAHAHMYHSEGTPNADKG